ncbi:xanthine dehydrogenase family protein subunit M [Verminephrobacter aporrectodeae subsp. tuberculatae]|uniref:FAD binding domain-containing protein n=1 Tax=Verminephrobacter aporrectodeae TaxID=1110389 RepID=UPI002244A84F|nr:xanthine dehydrogenase family protein subunit M [Verminephrobacter aporrectodeae]MCW8207446.1 xanthine dehydrogenase family protein subunit M [Verminephrobacter aporrectodeae subsp. tuberculatae]
MYTFTYETPATLADAAQRVAAGGKPIAGGQSLLPSMRLRLANPEQLIDLAGIAELAGIRRAGNALAIGAMARHMDVARSAEVRAAIPALADLAAHIGDRQVRARGTLGGSVANNDPAACYPSAVLGLGASIFTNRREIVADDFFLGMYSTALQEGELITAIHFPIPKRAAYLKFKQAASRFALVGVFVAQTDNGVRVAVTGAASSVFRHTALEAALTRNLTPESAAAVKIDASDLNTDIHASAIYRAQLISVQTQRAVARMVG